MLLPVEQIKAQYSCIYTASFKRNLYVTALTPVTLTFWERSSSRASKHLKLRLWTAILTPPNWLSPLLQKVILLAGVAVVTWARRMLERGGGGRGEACLDGGRGSHIPAWTDCMLRSHTHLRDIHNHEHYTAHTYAQTRIQRNSPLLGWCINHLFQ